MLGGAILGVTGTEAPPRRKLYIMVPKSRVNRKAVNDALRVLAGGLLL